MTATSRRLLVIDPSTNWPETQGAREVLRGWDGPSRIVTPALDPADLPSRDPDAYDADGVVLLGSRASVHDDLSWARELADRLKPILAGDRVVPFLAICYGHQLVAHLAGGEVDFVRPDRSKILGVEDTELVGSTLLPERSSLRAVVSHRESVQVGPDDYRVVARRDSSPIDGLEHRQLPIYTFQLHPEARDEFASSAGLDPSAVDARVRRDTGELLKAFRDRVRQPT